MFTTIVKVVKAFVLAWVATDFAVEAARTIRSKMDGRESEKLWDDYVQTLPATPYDEVTTSVDFIK